MLSWLEVPLIVGLLVVLSTGIAMLLSALFVYFRDIQPIWEVLSQVIFYASPIIIPIALVQAAPQPGARAHLHAQPAGGDLPAVPPRVHHPRHAERGVSCWARRLRCSCRSAIVVAIFVLGFWVFNRIAPRVAEDL